MSFVTDTYFPRLLEILEQDPSAAERLKLECGMCREKMTVDGEVECELPDGTIGFSHGAHILPCGHIFGLSCTVELRNHTFHESMQRQAENKCPTCRERLYYIPCKCPHVLGVPLQVEEGKRQEMLDKINRVKGMRDRCFACGLKIVAWKMKEEHDPYAGAEVEEDDFEMQFHMTLEPPEVKMVFKRAGDDAEWGIEAVRIGNRRYASDEIDPGTRLLLDLFVNQMAEMYFLNLVVSDKGLVCITAEISSADSELSIIEFDHS